jgi:hypothetical protein
VDTVVMDQKIRTSNVYDQFKLHVRNKIKDEKTKDDFGA